MAELKSKIIKQKTLCQIVYQEIKGQILEGILEPGDKILQEKMAASFGVSKIPLIQSLTILEKEGLLDKIPRKGFYVRDISEKELIDILEIKLEFERRGIIKIINNMSEEDERTLKNFLVKFEKYCKDNKNKEYFNLDYSFHSFLTKTSKNTIIFEFANNLNLLLLSYLRGKRITLNIKDSFKDHKELIEFILNGNLEMSLSSLEKHIANINKQIS